MASLKKNVSGQNCTFALVNTSTGGGLTGATVTVLVTKDNGSQASGGGTVTEKGSGQYNYAPTQAETNATDVGFLFAATGGVPVNLDYHTDIVDANGYLDVNVTDWNGTVVATPATAGIPDINVKNWNNQAVTLDANDAPNVSAKYWAGTAITATSIPVATAAGASGGLFIAGTNDHCTITNNFTVSGNWLTSGTTTWTGAAAFSAGLTSAITGNITGNLSGSVGSVTGAVGSVTGAVGSVTGNVGGNVVGSVASVTGNIGGNVVGSVGSVTGAVGSVTGAVGSVTGNVGGNVVGSVASVTGSVGSVVAVVDIDMTEAVPLSNTANTVGDCLNAARAQGFGAWSISGTALTLYAADGVTAVRTFTLNSATAPTSRT